uniref:CRAL-TRIO domain-containing protein n=1 Tax=Odontella aurita TaxID=265563 RepID=A0A7S4K4I3_9STRA|mmetsp:Transcript_60743/g.180062  ORF Transcript_60743/g.180062 Transcript_60743/m.180062 type:complete len:520 (+) Transcript_60743:47-1606(+)
MPHTSSKKEPQEGTSARESEREEKERMNDATKAQVKAKDEDEDDLRELSQLPPEVIRHASLFTPHHEALEIAALSDRERAEAHESIYGRPPPDQIRIERATAALDAALDVMTPLELGSLHKAREAFPLLFVSSQSHARVFLEAENCEPAKAVVRMLRYWEERERLLGEAAFAPDAMGPPAEEDILKAIQKRVRISMQKNNTDHSVSANGRSRRGGNVPRQEGLNLKILTVIRTFQQERLRLLNAELDQLPVGAKEAWMDAASTKPELANSDEHKIIFLHSVDYNPHHAARRLVSYWEMKYTLFGKGMAFGPIKVADLDDEEWGCRLELKDGVVHLSPGKDKFGRKIVIFRADKMLTDERHSHIGILRAMWYYLHASQFDGSACVHGFVLIVILPQGFSVSHINSNACQFAVRMQTLTKNCVPLKCMAIHDCLLTQCNKEEEGRGLLSQTWFSAVCSMFKHLIGRAYRQRYWLHVGTKEEELANFLKCGITKAQLPNELGGTFNVAFIRQFLDEQRAKDS